MEAGFFLPEPNDEAEAGWLAELQQAYPGQYDEWGTGGERPADEGGSDPTLDQRAAELRQLAEQMVTQADRWVRTLCTSWSR